MEDKLNHVTFHIDGQKTSLRYQGATPLWETFDRMAKAFGTTRSHLVTLFVEECAKTGKIPLPQFAGWEYEDKNERVSGDVSFNDFGGTITV